MRFASWAYPWQAEEQYGAILTVTKDGEISVAEDGLIFDVEDFDKDGRPDLLLHSSKDEECMEDHPEGKCVRQWGPTTVRLSLPDGSFGGEIPYPQEATTSPPQAPESSKPRAPPKKRPSKKRK
ncbi:hypothetical protein LVJ94_48990 [Pendulispora rubella]|uniref:Uncharacterized protein n=1 Tax=Pendulispora rubella TaxID=2741070 RepID=A0ABZ2L1U4_9BACT